MLLPFMLDKDKFDEQKLRHSHLEARIQILGLEKNVL